MNTRTNRMEEVLDGCAKPRRVHSLSQTLLRCAPLYLVGVFYAGCASSQVQYRDTDFNATRLRNGHLAVAAISGVRDNEMVMNALSEEIQRHLGCGAAAIKVVPLEEVRRWVPPDAYKAVVREVSGKLGPEEADIRAWSGVASQARYLLWVHLSEMHDYQAQFDQTVTESRRTYNAETKKHEWVEERVGYEISRNASLVVDTDLWIYDLELGRFVWKAKSKGSSRTSASASSQGISPPSPPAWPRTPGLYPALRTGVLKALNKLPRR